MRTIALLVAVVLLCPAQRRETERPVRHAVRGTRAAVAAGSEYAAEAGMRMLHAGGNAVDAGVAATLAAAVTEFSHFGFGGEAPILIRTRDGKVHAIAGLGPMPKAATAQFFRERKIQPGETISLDRNGIEPFVPPYGIMPALVPGMVEGVLVALREFGTKPFSEIAAPAIDLADTMPLDETRAAAIARARKFFELWPTSKRVYMPGDRAPQAGDVLRQPDLAATLRSMVAAEKAALKRGAKRQAAIDAVRDHFYRGDIARRIDAFSRANGGLLRYEDMAGFRVKVEPAVSTTYRGYEIYKPGFWSQGPSMIQALNILEAVNLSAKPGTVSHFQEQEMASVPGSAAAGHNSPEYIHTVVEALKLAYADRDTYYGDPAFSDIPAALLTKEYAAGRRALIGPRASLEFLPGEPGGKRLPHPSSSTRITERTAARDTTCVDAIDRDGIMFSATPSGAWLPSVIAGDTGIPLTQRAQSFLLNEGSPNVLAGGKRPRITLSPTLVTKGGRPFVVLSTPGGDNQDQALLQVLLNVIEFGMNAQRAVEAPRFQTRHLVSSFDNHGMNPGDLVLDERIPQETFAALSARGHKTSARARYASGAAPVMIRIAPDGVIEAGADPFGYRVAHAW